MPPKRGPNKKMAEEVEASPVKQRRVLRSHKKDLEEKPIVKESIVKPKDPKQPKAPKQPKSAAKKPANTKSENEDKSNIEAESTNKAKSKIEAKSKTEGKSIEEVTKQNKKGKTGTEIQNVPNKSETDAKSIEEVPKQKKKGKKVTEIQSNLSNLPETNGNNINVGCSKKNANGKSFNLKITSWNVSGLRAWLKKDGLSLMLQEQPDLFCIQETKCSEIKLPKEIRKVSGYFSYWCSSKKEGYAGVGVLSKIEPLNIMYGIKDEAHDEEGRCIALEFDTFYVINVYVPNAGRDLKTLSKRLEWNTLFKSYVKALDDTKPVILCGDMNVAHSEIDLTNPKTNKNHAGFTQQERDGMSDFLQDGYVDSFRFLYPDVTNVYTFWSYMGQARAKNIGWRLDYFIVSERLKHKVCDSTVASEVYGSDHCPINLFISV